jgi:hypothetical protein
MRSLMAVLAVILYSQATNVVSSSFLGRFGLDANYHGPNIYKDTKP